MVMSHPVDLDLILTWISATLFLLQDSVDVLVAKVDDPGSVVSCCHIVHPRATIVGWKSDMVGMG